MSLFRLIFRFIDYLLALSLADSNIVQSDGAIKTEENVPAIRPKMIGKANSLTVATEKTARSITITIVVKVVYNERVIVSLTALLATFAGSYLPSKLSFLISRVLSKSTMVALIEYAIIVITAAMKDVLTCTWNIIVKAIVMRASWSKAITALRPLNKSNLIQIYKSISTDATATATNERESN